MTRTSRRPYCTVPLYRSDGAGLLWLGVELVSSSGERIVVRSWGETEALAVQRAAEHLAVEAGDDTFVPREWWLT